jgi:hypothetical protein
MGARKDLLEVAGALASQARASVDGTSIGRLDYVQAVSLSQGAKAALEAAALVDAEPAPIIAALHKLTAKLDENGIADALVLEDLTEISGPAEALEHVGELLVAANSQVKVGHASIYAYNLLHTLLDGLLIDFRSADSETSRRIAARIESGLDAAHSAIGELTKPAAPAARNEQG